MYSCTYTINNNGFHIDNAIYIGISTRQLLNQLIDNGEATHTEERRFYQALRAFYCTVKDYASNTYLVMIQFYRTSAM